MFDHLVLRHVYSFGLFKFVMLRNDLFSGMFNHLLLGHVYSPHLCVGFLFLILYPTASSASASSVSQTNVHTPTLSHTNFHTPSFTHHLCHTPTLSHTTFHTPTFTHHLSHILFHTPSFTHHFLHTNFVTHKLCHTNFVTHQLCHTPNLCTPTLSHTNFVTHQLCYTNFVTHHLSHTIFVTHQLSHTAWQAWHLLTSTLALGDIHLRVVWQVWHLATLTFVFAWQAWWRAWSPVTPPNFAWQAWHLATSTFVSRGRCVALGHIYLRFAWQGWHLWHWAGSGGALGRAGAHLVANDAAQLCVAGMALGDIHLRFAWLWHFSTSTCVLRGRRGTWSLPLWPWRRPSFRVAGAGCPPLVVTKLRDIR